MLRFLSGLARQRAIAEGGDSLEIVSCGTRESRGTQPRLSGLSISSKRHRAGRRLRKSDGSPKNKNWTTDLDADDLAFEVAGSVRTKQATRRPEGVIEELTRARYACFELAASPRSISLLVAAQTVRRSSPEALEITLVPTAALSLALNTRKLNTFLSGLDKSHSPRQVSIFR